MSSARVKKRRHTSPDVEVVSSSKRKIRSCDACRRLKTRCEVEAGLIASACHRCRILSLHCSFVPVSDNNPAATSVGHSETPVVVTVSRPCDCDQRLRDLEASLAEVHSILEQRPSTAVESPIQRRAIERPKNQDETANRSMPNKPHKSHEGGMLVAGRNSRTAPMNLIRDITQQIIGTGNERQAGFGSGDVVAKGIITEELALTLLAGFSQLSRRWLFMETNPVLIRQTSSLLFSCCILAGLHINPGLHGTKMHHELYQHVSRLLSKNMLMSLLPLETIQSMLIFSMWNLAPDKDSNYIDSWLLSGTVAMHGMLAINFEQLMQLRTDGKVDPRSRKAIRSWNLICLCHLQFCVGTGRPPVVSKPYLDQCENVLSLPSYNSRDQLVAAGVRLYALLCSLVNSNRVQTDSLVWQGIDDWKESCGHFYNLDGSKPLRFAYSCTYLILSRRTLKYLGEQEASDEPSSTTAASLDSALFVELAVAHAHQILNLFLEMSDLTAFIRPAYENLLCSFAMVTLSEFASSLSDPEATLATMEKTVLHVQLGGRAEPVSKWALNVLRKFLFDLKQSAVQEGGIESNETDAGDLESAYDFDPSLMLNIGEYSGFSDQQFPSLEEMFLNI